jgi:NitT/TauT family transport system substrate-binding protein
MIGNIARAACLAAATALATATGAQALQLTVSHYKTLVISLPYAVATEKGYWKEEGVNIDNIVAGHGGGTAIRNLMASDMPVGELALSAAITAANSGIKIRILADTANTIGEVSWVARKNSGITKIADLAGKKVAYTSPRSVTEAIIKTVLKRHGLLDKCQTIAAGGLGPALTALNQDAVDAAPIVDPAYTKKGKNYQFVFRAAKELPDLSWSVFVTTDAFLKTHEDLVRRILRARAKAVDFIYAHPAETEKIYAKYWNVSDADAKAMLPKFYKIRIWKRGQFNMKGFATMIEGLELIGALKPNYDIKPLLDYRFAAMLKEKAP